MENLCFKDRVGCSLLEWPVIACKEMLPTVGFLTASWALGRKVTLEQSFLGYYGMLSFIDKFFSPKSAALYRYNMQEMQKQTLKDHTQSLIFWAGLPLLLELPFLVRACEKFPKLNEVRSTCAIVLKPSFSSVVQEVVTFFFLPLYYYGLHNPSRDGKFAAYVPLSRQEGGDLKMRIWEVVFNGISLQKADPRIVEGAFYSTSATIFSKYLEELETGSLPVKKRSAFEERMKALRAPPVNCNMKDAETFYEHFIEGRTWSTRVYDTCMLWLTEVAHS